MSVLARIREAGGGRGAFVQRTVKARGPFERVLDVGCAWGWGLAALRDYADELWGVDLDERALEYARATYPFLHLGRVDGADLPFETESFDLVLLTDVIEHVDNGGKRRLIAEAHRVLRPGGTLILTAPHAGLLAWADPMDVKRRAAPIYRVYMRLTGYTPDTPPEIGHRHVSVSELRALLEERFEIEELHLGGVLTSFVSWPLAVNSRLRFLPQRVDRALGRFRDWESGVRSPRALAEHVRLVARRLDGAPTARSL